MATYHKFDCFVADEANKIHNLASDTLTVALTDSIPIATNSVIANISQISYTNLSSRNITTTSSTQTSGTYKLLLATPLTLTASGPVGPFRYVLVYNSSSASGSLICWFDYGAENNMVNGDTFIVNFDGTNGLFQQV